MIAPASSRGLETGWLEKVVGTACVWCSVTCAVTSRSLLGGVMGPLSSPTRDAGATGGDFAPSR